MLPFGSEEMTLSQTGESCLSCPFTAPQFSQADCRAGGFLHSFGLLCFPPEGKVFPSYAAETRLHVGKTGQSKFNKQAKPKPIL